MTQAGDAVVTGDAIPGSGDSFAIMFTPYHAAIGGLIIGIAVVGKLLLTGRVLGISGTLKGLVQQKGGTSWRIAFLCGMGAGAALLPAFAGPGIFRDFPNTFTVQRMALSGLAVGFGAALGNGCTSGHSVCGNARLSLRSVLFTVTFMAACALSATLFRTSAALHTLSPAGPGTLVLDAGGPGEVGWMATVAGCAALLLASLGAVGMRLSALQPQMELLAEFACGCVMALGLGFSGMVHPAKLAAFFSGAFVPEHPWDPSLLLVMGAAVLTSVIGYQSLAGRLPLLPEALTQKPAVVAKYDVSPPSSAVDAQLLLGATLFGLGMGGSGFCPGPALVVLLGHLTPQVAAYYVSVLLGMHLEGMYTRYCTANLGAQATCTR